MLLQGESGVPWISADLRLPWIRSSSNTCRSWVSFPCCSKQEQVKQNQMQTLNMFYLVHRVYAERQTQTILMLHREILVLPMGMGEKKRKSYSAFIFTSLTFHRDPCLLHNVSCYERYSIELKLFKLLTVYFILGVKVIENISVNGIRTIRKRSISK